MKVKTRNILVLGAPIFLGILDQFKNMKGLKAPCPSCFNALRIL